MQTETIKNTIDNDQVEAEKVRALQSHLDLTDDEVNEITLEDGELYHIHGNEYKVLTDDEADDEVKEYIEQSVWAFNPSFLSAHAKDGIDEDVFKALSEKCENSNETVKSLIKDFDHFVDDAVLSDGRGHFLSSYDGNEHEVNIKGNYYYIYRTN
jgi:hypothetical protein